MRLSSKLDRIEELFEELAAEESRKIVLFSEWTIEEKLLTPLPAKKDPALAALDMESELHSIRSVTSTRRRRNHFCCRRAMPHCQAFDRLGF